MLSEERSREPFVVAFISELHELVRSCIGQAHSSFGSQEVKMLCHLLDGVQVSTGDARLLIDALQTGAVDIEDALSSKSGIVDGLRQSAEKLERDWPERHVVLYLSANRDKNERVRALLSEWRITIDKEWSPRSNAISIDALETGSGLSRYNEFDDICRYAENAILR